MTWPWLVALAVLLGLALLVARLLDRAGLVPGPTPREAGLPKAARRRIARAVSEGRAVDDSVLADAARVRALVLRERAETYATPGYRRFQYGLAVLWVGLAALSLRDGPTVLGGLQLLVAAVSALNPKVVGRRIARLRRAERGNEELLRSTDATADLPHESR